MKTIIAVTFFGILMCVSANVSDGKKNCYREAKSGFDLTKFSKLPQAYVTHSKDELKGDELKVLCRKFQIEERGNEVVITLYGSYQYRGQTFHAKIQCNAKKGSVTNGQFDMTCKAADESVEDKEKSKEEKLYMSVIDTDYTTYAVLYNCLVIEGHGAIETFVVLKTDKDAKNDNVEEALKNTELDLKKFTPNNNPDCDKWKK